MDPIVAVTLASALLLVLLSLRVPVALSLLSSGVMGLLLLRGFSYTEATLGRIPYQTPARYVLIVIPLFIAMGVFAKHGTLAEDAFAVTKPLLRKFPGGLAIATLATCGGFAAISGSSVATVATVGPIAIKEMRKEGYQTAFAAGVVASAGTLGVLIPPSIALVLFGIVTGESIGLLLIAGIVPGLLSAFGYGLAIVIRVKLRPELGGRAGVPAQVVANEKGVATERSNTADHLAYPQAAVESPRGRLTRLLSLSRVAVLFLVVIGGIYLGLMTASEAAAMGALLALLFLVWDARRDRASFRSTITASLAESISLTSMVFALLIGASIFTLFVVAAGIPAMFTSWAVGLELAPWLIVGIILLAFVPLGMFLDPISMLLVGVPLTYPVVTSLGYEGIWFGILIVKMVELALITPPVGINGYVVAGAAEDVEVSQVFRGVAPFFLIDVITIAIFFAFPALIMWLPNLAGVQ